MSLSSPNHPVPNPPSLGTFLDRPGSECALETARVQILGCPFDGTSTFGKGGDRGPRALIDVSDQLEEFDLELGDEPHRAGIHLLPFVEFEDDDPVKAVEAIRGAALAGLRAAPPGLDPLLIGLGGEHTVTVGLTRAVRELRGPFSVLQIDAHADLRAEYAGSPYNHACVMRRLAEDDPEAPLVSVGVRAVSREERDFAVQHGVHLFPAMARDPAGRWIDEAVSKLEGPVYVTFDLDGLDPSVLPSTGTPVPGGLGWDEVLALLRAVARRHPVVGADVNELRPDGVNHHSEFLAAQLVYKMVGYFVSPGLGADRS